MKSNLCRSNRVRITFSVTQFIKFSKFELFAVDLPHSSEICSISAQYVIYILKDRGKIFIETKRLPKFLHSLLSVNYEYLIVYNEYPDT